MTAAQRYAWAGLGLAGASAFSLLLKAQGVAVPWPQCWLRSHLGVPAPSCGLTRSLVALLRGHWLESLQYHLFGPVVVLVGIGVGLRALQILLTAGWLRSWGSFGFTELITRQIRRLGGEARCAGLPTQSPDQSTGRNWLTWSLGGGLGAFLGYYLLRLYLLLGDGAIHAMLLRSPLSEWMYQGALKL